MTLLIQRLATTLATTTTTRTRQAQQEPQGRIMTNLSYQRKTLHQDYLSQRTLRPLARRIGKRSLGLDHSWEDATLEALARMSTARWRFMP
jgi:hypothetical protein